jgi:hypothetical protein
VENWANFPQSRRDALAPVGELDNRESHGQGLDCNSRHDPDQLAAPAFRRRPESALTMEPDIPKKSGPKAAFG